MTDDRFNQLFSSGNEDADLDDWALPDAVLTRKMVAQIEYYLSDDNLAKDAFLLKHVRRNKMGYVNIKLLTSFKKMKHLTRDWKITAHALRHHSSKLELNAEGNKVRRRAPVPESLLVQVPGRQLLVWNLSDGSLTGPDAAPLRGTMETAISILEPFGSICTVRVFRPGKELPPEVRRYSYRFPQLCYEESVLVEYDHLDSAKRAYSQLSQAEEPVKVLLLGRTSKKKAGSEDRGTGRDVAVVNRRMTQLQYGGDDSSACSSSESEATSCSPLHRPRSSPRVLCSSAGSSPRPSPRSSPRLLHAAPQPTPRVSPRVSPLRVSPLLASEVWASPEVSPERRWRSHKNTTENGQGPKSATENGPGLKNATENGPGPKNVTVNGPDLKKVTINGQGPKNASENGPSPSPRAQGRKPPVKVSLLEDSAVRQSRGGSKRVPLGDPLPLGVIRFPYGPDGTSGFRSTVSGPRSSYTPVI